MSDFLRTRRIFITAAGQGIGRATAERCIAEGAEVYATDIDPDSLSGLDCHTQALDVRDDTAIRSFVSRFGAMDVLFNCAGYVSQGTIMDCTDEEWDRTFELNVKSMYRTIRAFLPPMLKAGGGTIINMSSVAGSVKGVPNRCVYGTSKAAVIGLSKAVAADFVEQGIRCHAICPGTVQSPSLEARLANTGDYQAARRQFISRQPMGRIGTAEEVAALVVYLAGEASYTTGQIHIIDGGWSN